MKYKVSLVWIRRDLRLEDNIALSRACAESEKVILVFIFDTNILSQLSSKEDRRVTFIYDSVMELDHELRSCGSALVCRHGDPVEEIPLLAREVGADAVFLNEDYAPYAIQRDKKVHSALKKIGISSQAFEDHVIFSGQEVMKKDGSPYRVFTPYKKAWLQKLKRENYQVSNRSFNFCDEKSLRKYLKTISLEKMGFIRASFVFDFQKPGRKNGLKILKKYTSQLKDYHETRNSLEGGTSGLSVHLRFGTLSIRECVQASLSNRSEGSAVWLSELIWREFYQMILLQFPYVFKSCFQKKYDAIQWSDNEEHFKAWCEGRTGYPIVDAGMRELKATGWMSNRLRMVTATFLVKDLLIDWRRGERYFAEYLLDFELASNNGGWQWCASTGCDAQPYFRIFNPIRQSQQFDPDGEFIKKWVPELEHRSKKEIHYPLSGNLELGESENLNHYPGPIVAHDVQKKLALQMFKKVSELT